MPDMTHPWRDWQDGVSGRRECGIPACAGQRYARGWCHKHYERWRTKGDPLSVASGRPWGDDIGYDSAHHRVRANRGPAKLYSCLACGGPASDWALSYSRGKIKMDPKRRRYSLDPNDYEPMCRPCHKALDANARRTIDR